jgi:DNA-binding NtrC family response regulator
MPPAENKRPILLVEDETSVRAAMAESLSLDFNTQQAGDAAAALSMLEKQLFAVVLLDIRLGSGMSGAEFLKKIKSTWPKTEVVMVTGDTDSKMAVQCLQDGAFAYLTKPFDLVELRTVAQRAAEKWQLAREHEFDREVAGKWSRPPEILGQSASISLLRQRIAELARGEEILLIHGEPGTGRELAARTLHDQSARNKERFVAASFNGKAFSVVEEQLFGLSQEESAGVWREKRGLCDYALGGTLYLGEVTGLPTGIVSKLVEASKLKSFTRPGSSRKIPFDIRLIFSTRYQPQSLAAKGIPEGAMRQTLAVPSLRERPEDIAELFHVFVRRTCEARELPTPKVSEAFLEAYKAHPFTGNVRELASRTENLVLSSQGKEITLSSLPVEFILEAKAKTPSFLRQPFKTSVQEFERQIIQEALSQAQGSMKKTCDILGMHRNSLRVKLKELKIYSKRRKLVLKPV